MLPVVVPLKMCCRQQRGGRSSQCGDAAAAADGGGQTPAACVLLLRRWLSFRRGAGAGPNCDGVKTNNRGARGPHIYGQHHCS